MAKEERYSESPEIAHKLDALKGQKSPCAVFIGFQSGLDSGIREVHEFNFDKILRAVELLREHNIDAVPVFSELAIDPSKTVVTAGGIQTPVHRSRKD